MLKRRRFLKWLSFSAIGVAVAGGAYIAWEDFDNLAKKIIKEDTKGLRIGDTVIDQFMADVKKYRKWESTFFSYHKQLIKGHYYLDNPLFSLPYASSYDVNRAKIVGIFLLSTDFFTNKMEMNRTINYAGLYDPYRQPCANPFSNVFYPDT